MAMSFEVMAGPFKAQPRVQHSFPIPGTAQTCVIAQLPMDFLHSCFFGSHSWHWKTCTERTSSHHQVSRRFRLINKRICTGRTCNQTSHKFRLQNAPFHPRTDVSLQEYPQMDGLKRTLSEEEASIRDYFQMDGYEKDEGDDHGAATDCGSSDGGDDIADCDDVLDPNSATPTNHHLCNGAQWADDAPVHLHYIPALERECAKDELLDLISSATKMRQHRAEPDWVKKRGGRVRLAAYLRGMSLPEFKPSWEAGVDHIALAASAVLVEPAAEPTEEPHAVPVEQTTVVPKQPKADTEDTEDWEAYDAMPLAELWSTLEKNTLENKPQPPVDEWEVVTRRTGQSEAAKPCSFCKSTKVQPKNRSRMVKVLQKTPAAEKQPVQETKSSASAVEQAATVAPPLRFQGKIKAREYNKTKRGSKMNFGFIEVNPRDLKALRLHPLWTSDLEIDVFWHWKDGEYDSQYAGDIVKFTVVLKPEGGCLQAKHLELVRRAEYWHAVAM